MKHLWSTHEFTLRQQRRQRKFDRRRHLAQKRQTALRERPTRLRSTRSRQREPSLRKLRAPETLSLFNKPDETLKYCNTLRDHLTQPDMEIFLDLGDVQNFTSDALLLIRAIMDSRAYHTQIRGNLPRDPTVASEFKASGFFAGFAKPPTDLPPAKGLILKKSSDKVLAEMAAELVDFAKEHVPMTEECANACSQTLVEAMTNTHNHAGDRKPVKRQKRRKRRFPQKWLASVYCRDQVAYFSFIDLGIGILNSKSAKNWLQKIGASLLSYRRTELLKDAFEGNIGSATGKPGRGLGLPRMKRDAKEGTLSDLQVLTSDVVGAVADLNFAVVAHSLCGTAFRWCTRPEELSND